MEHIPVFLSSMHTSATVAPFDALLVLGELSPFADFSASWSVDVDGVWRAPAFCGFSRNDAKSSGCWENAQSTNYSLKKLYMKVECKGAVVTYSEKVGNINK